jgi:putative ABC transport system permease protein
MSLLIGSLTIGLILALLALGVLISFRIFSFPDITVDGSVTLGAAVAATLLVAGYNPWLATAVAAFSGALAGAATGILHTRFAINGLLAGILVMTSLYSVNLHVMGKSNVPLLSVDTLATSAERAGTWVTRGAASIDILGWEVAARDLSILIAVFLIIVALGALLYAFFRTSLGTTMRATGDNDQMVRALGVDHRNMILIGLAVSNGLVALSGALLAQFQGFADVQMGIGMVVWGLASVIIGEALTGGRQLGLTITGAVMGSVLFRLLVAIALRWGLNPNDLKLITALFVFIALTLPVAFRRARFRRPVLRAKKVPAAHA